MLETEICIVCYLLCSAFLAFGDHLWHEIQFVLEFKELADLCLEVLQKFLGVGWNFRGIYHKLCHFVYRRVTIYVIHFGKFHDCFVPNGLRSAGESLQLSDYIWKFLFNCVSKSVNVVLKGEDQLGKLLTRHLFQEYFEVRLYFPHFNFYLCHV